MKSSYVIEIHEAPLPGMLHEQGDLISCLDLNDMITLADQLESQGVVLSTEIMDVLGEYEKARCCL